MIGQVVEGIGPALSERTECDMIFDLGHYENLENMSVTRDQLKLRKQNIPMSEVRMSGLFPLSSACRN